MTESDQRPAPLFQHPDLVRLLEPHPLTDEPGMHARFLAENVSGRTLLVAGSVDRLDRLTGFLEDLGLPEIDAVHNDTSLSRDLDDTPLPPAHGQYDTVVYSKETTAWFARSKDFQRLTERLGAGGTLLSKCKWLPGSDRLRLDELAVAEPFAFQSPQVYAAWTKTETQTTLDAAVHGPATQPVERAADGGAAARPDRRGLAAQTRGFDTQFDDDAHATTYEPGWSWHSPLQAFVDEWTGDVDGPVVNLCCGSNSLGDVRVDLLREWTDDDGDQQATAATVQGDAMRAPLARNSAAGAITDPPWKIPVEARVRLFSEAQRVVEPGGRILQNSWWLPFHPYATFRSTRAVTANVQDYSLAGPGGLSFLTEYEVLEQPDLGDCTYTQADHMDRLGVDALDDYRDWGWSRPKPHVEPGNDPRIVDGDVACWRCGSRGFGPRHLPRGKTLFDCHGCGFRYSAVELLEGGTDWYPEDHPARDLPAPGVSAP